MDWINAVSHLRFYMDKLAGDPVSLRSDEMVHKTIEACAVILPRFKLLATSAAQETMQQSYPQIGFTLNSFYNETVAFLVDGKPRSTPLTCWSSILTAYMRDLAGTAKVKQLGSLGAMTMAASMGMAGEVRDLGKSHQATVPDRRLLSYADHELLAKWLISRDGYADMVSALAVFLTVAHPE